MRVEVRESRGAGLWRWLLWGAIAALLILPLVAMRFTQQVMWDGPDFAAAALLLGGAGLSFELVMRYVRKPAHRAVMSAALVFAMLLIWAQGAVGIL